MDYHLEIWCTLPVPCPLGGGLFHPSLIYVGKSAIPNGDTKNRFHSDTFFHPFYLLNAVAASSKMHFPHLWNHKCCLCLAKGISEINLLLQPWFMTAVFFYVFFVVALESSTFFGGESCVYYIYDCSVVLSLGSSGKRNVPTSSVRRSDNLTTWWRSFFFFFYFLMYSDLPQVWIILPEEPFWRRIYSFCWSRGMYKIYSQLQIYRGWYFLHQGDLASFMRGKILPYL